MSWTAKTIKTGLLTLALLLPLTTSAGAGIVNWPDTSAGDQKLFLLGFGELTMHALDVSGNRDAFESANPMLEDDVATNYRFSMFANGPTNLGFHINGAAVVDSRIGEEYHTIDPSVFRLRMSVETTEPLWDGWRFTGRGIYDPARLWELENLDKRLLTQPQDPSRLELLMRLQSDEHGLIEGGSIRPSFKGAAFTLHQRSLFGVYADLHTEKAGLEAVGGKLEGKSFREGDVLGIRANGTGGPYNLSHAPVTRGSDQVKIEVRDINNETEVVSSRTLIRDIDYTVDYLLGKITLHQPVASETITGDPVYIVITFDYLRDDNDDLYGGRARLMPSDNFQVSGSALHRNLDPGSTSPGVAEPEDLFAADAKFGISDHTTGYVEAAGGKNPGDGDQHDALRVGATSEVIDGLTLKGDFQTIDDRFRSFTNSDLNPTKNQRRLNLGGQFDLTERQKVTARFSNYRGLEANGEFNNYDGKRDEKVYAAGYRNDLTTKFKFGVQVERREIEDALNANHEENHNDHVVADVDGRLAEDGVFGELDYAANYELIMFRNDLGIGKNDFNSNQFAIGLASRPSERAYINLAQRLFYSKDQDNDLYDQRQDVTIASLQFRPGEAFNTLSTYEYKRYTVPGSSLSMWQDDPTRTDWAGTIALEYLPLRDFKALGRFGRQATRQWFTDSTTLATDDFALAQLTYFHTHHLSFNGESEYRRKAFHGQDRRRDKTWDLGLRVNWNRDRLTEFTAGMIRRWQLQDYAAGNEVTSTSYIVLLSGATSLTKHIFARASVKGILLNDPLDDEKTFARLEAGYDSHDWFRVSLGYERIESDVTGHSNLNYTGQGLFVRFTGKM